MRGTASITIHNVITTKCESLTLHETNLLGEKEKENSLLTK